MKNIFGLIILILCSCDNSSQNNQTNYTSNNNGVASNSYDNSNVDYIIDNSVIDDRYEKSPVNSGSYLYNYDIKGTDQNGNNVQGNIDIEGKYGNGYIEDADGNQKSIDVEWMGYGELEGTDEDGNSYEFEVDN